MPQHLVTTPFSRHEMPGETGSFENSLGLTGPGAGSFSGAHYSVWN